MNINDFFLSFLNIINEMSPYLLLGFLIAGILHVFVPKKFYGKYLSSENKFSVLWAALLGIPLPLCSCGVIPTAVGLKNEKASKGAVASFLIATPQTGIDSILATFSLMGLGFAVVRPAAALITGVFGGLLVNRFVGNTNETSESFVCDTENKSNVKDNALQKIGKVLKYAYFEMIQDIGLRLIIGLIIAALINVAVPDEFFLNFGSNPLLQMLVILIIAVPMYICSTGSIPIAASLMLKGLSPGAALVMLMAGPAVNLASILVVKKSLGLKFLTIYLSSIIVGAVIFGLLLNLVPSEYFISSLSSQTQTTASCCSVAGSSCEGTLSANGAGGMLIRDNHSLFSLICSILLVLFIINALTMKFLSKFKKEKIEAGTIIYGVDDMHCNHCKKAVEEAAMKIKGVNSAEANVGANTLTGVGNPKDDDIKRAVETAGFIFRGRK